MTSTPSIIKSFKESELKLVKKNIKKWLICGKGPSSANYFKLDDSYLSIAINQAVEKFKFDFWHVIDIEVLSNYDLNILENFDYLIMPWVPHVEKKRYFYEGENFYSSGNKNLDDLSNSNEIIRNLKKRGRIFSYQLSNNISDLKKDLPIIEPTVNSSGLIYNLLKSIEASEIRTIGIDGGYEYADNFKKYEDKKLTTSHKNFNEQFLDIANSIFKSEILSGPLDMNLPINVYVGCEPEQEIAFDVLNYSIKKHSSISTNVTKLHEEVISRGISIGKLDKEENQEKTPFSFQRFCIPELNNFKHKALYMDSDMLVLNDLRDLCKKDFQEQEFLSCAIDESWERLPQLSVMYIDCERSKWDVKDIINSLNSNKYSYSEVFDEAKFSKKWSRSLPSNWNSLEHLDENTCLLHFTDMDTQPWINAFHPYAEIWVKHLKEAIDNNFCTIEKVKIEIKKGNIRPSLLYQLEKNIFNSFEIPFNQLISDNINYFPIHRKKSSMEIKIKFTIKRYSLTLMRFFSKSFNSFKSKIRYRIKKFLDLLSYER